MKTYKPLPAWGNDPWQHWEKSLFGLGVLITTPGIIRILEEHGENVNALQSFLHRHQSGDWGDVDDGDKRENDLSVQDGFRILSAYQLYYEKVWVITEADRSVTTVLLPSEY